MRSVSDGPGRKTLERAAQRRRAQHEQQAAQRAAATASYSYPLIRAAFVATEAPPDHRLAAPQQADFKQAHFFQGKKKACMASAEQAKHI